MNQALFEAVDRYIEEMFVSADPVLDAAIQAAADAEMPAIQISSTQGKLLYLFARMTGAQRILELGTLAGYSTIWLGRAVCPGGRVTSLEISPKHAEVARVSIERAGLADCVEVVVGPALESLAQLKASGAPPFDMVFIDADKPAYPAYLEAVLPLTRPGSLILADNVIREGAVLDAGQGDDMARGAHAFNTALAAHPALEAVLLQQVGAKGHDGLAIAIVRP